MEGTPLTDELRGRKRELRAEIRCRLAALPGLAIQNKSIRIASSLFETEWWRGASWVFGYIDMLGEVQTREMIAQAYRDRKEVAIPRIEGEELSFYQYHGHTQDLLPNQFGILEPDPVWTYVDPAALGQHSILILTPGLAFDRRRQRLGRGKGFYDRFLARVRGLPVSATAVGLAFTEQLLEEVPAAPHDLPVDGIVTDREVLG